ncbi:hypothetical protein E4O92_11560 [Massilia horti]|uniref:Lipoprotein n=2 Tax=Massilia horti TaxID=2562153 RepID=A0A4Y9T248_9BURK|nr:hypothetical protein [Massilia horti]TFW31967.1 hypothetical protein E4O92_11560 [Massilia horti]
MKNLLIASSLVALAGCAAAPPGPPNYGTRAAYAQPYDQSQWHVVSVTPVPAGTGARVAASGDTGTITSSAPTGEPNGTTSSTMPYSAPQAGTVVSSQPVYVPTPVYVQAPIYAPPPAYYTPPVYAAPYYWYPPISIGLGFSWGRWGGGHWGGGHWGGGHGGWGGHGGGHGGGRHR